MKKVEYICDKCGERIDGTTNSDIIGGGELCTLIYQGIMGHNQFPSSGFHFHYHCFSGVVMAILNQKKGGVK